ncbi:hypothetical protein [Herbaspirillum rubrisubalbicans]|nr:hypothetical protein [Herbaspirillum rubrisubalbicans]
MLQLIGGQTILRPIKNRPLQHGHCRPRLLQAAARTELSRGGILWLFEQLTRLQLFRGCVINLHIFHNSNALFNVETENPSRLTPQPITPGGHQMLNGSAEDAVPDEEVRVLLQQLERLGSILESLLETFEEAAIDSQARSALLARTAAAVALGKARKTH